VHDPLDLRDLVGDELAQRRQTGYRVDVAQQTLEGLDPADHAGHELVLSQLEQAERDPTWPYVEPESSQILEHLPEEEPPAGGLPDALVSDRIAGAWLGRCIGCALGKPVEGWRHEDLVRYLTRVGESAITDYLPPPGAVHPEPPLRDCWPETTRGGIEYMARDDDIDYTILGLHVLEERGPQFTAFDVAQEWLSHLPFTRVYTAERAAYRNLILGLRPPNTAAWRNPYREWIGAMIRADIFGYVHPDNPRQAALLALEDATVSHTGNGLYASMWAAALVGEAIRTGDSLQAVIGSLRHVPPQSRLGVALSRVVDLHAAGRPWELVLSDIEEAWGHLGWVHAVNNAAAVAAAILYGAGDFGRTVGLAVLAGWDTDSNGATAGSVAGALIGRKEIPSVWADPINDDIRSAVFGFERSRVGELATRTLQLRQGLGQESVGRTSFQISTKEVP
jgi:ADP-ribosylglycohydrolase